MKAIGIHDHRSTSMGSRQMLFLKLRCRKLDSRITTGSSKMHECATECIALHTLLIHCEKWRYLRSGEPNQELFRM